MFKCCVNTSNKEGLVSLNMERQELIILQLIDVFARKAHMLKRSHINWISVSCLSAFGGVYMSMVAY